MNINSWMRRPLRAVQNPGNYLTYIVNVDGDIVTEISPGQIRGQIPTPEDKLAIAEALVNEFNLPTFSEFKWS